MRVARALMPGEGIITVNLGKDIPSLNSVKFTDDIDILKKKLDNEKDKNVIGISDFKVGKILFKEDGTYICQLYVSMKQIAGEWTII